MSPIISLKLTTKELNKRTFKAKGENIKQAIDIYVTFISENKLQITFVSILNPC